MYLSFTSKVVSRSSYFDCKTPDFVSGKILDIGNFEYRGERRIGVAKGKAFLVDKCKGQRLC